MYSKLQDGSFIVCGALPKDAEYKQVGQNNSSLTKFGVKVGEKPSANANEKPQAIWRNCDCWHTVARAAMNFKKGDVVLAVGKIVVNEYEGKQYKNLVCEFVMKMQENKPVIAEQTTLDGFKPSGIPDLSEYEILSDGEAPF